MLLLILVATVCVLSAFGVAVFSVSDITVASETPVDEYTGDYKELDEQSESVEESVTLAIEQGDATVSGIAKYNGAYEVDGVVYEIDQSRTYIQVSNHRIVI